MVFVFCFGLFFSCPVSEEGRNWEVLSTLLKMPGKSTTASSLTGCKTALARVALTLSNLS